MTNGNWVSVRLLDVPGYAAWSQLHEDEPALIAHLDATEMLRPPDELGVAVAPEVFDDMLAALRSDLTE